MKTVKVKSEIAGRVWKVVAKPGHAVAQEETLMILESMKMEIPVPSPASGTLKELWVEEGEEVREGQDLALLQT